MQVLILGAGAVGTFLGARLALSGHKVVLVGRAALVAAVRDAGGLVLIGPAGERQAVSGVVAATSVAAALAEHGPYDLALLTVKAYDTATAAAELHGAPSAALPPEEGDRGRSPSAALRGPHAEEPAGRGRSGAGGPILTLQNGIGNEEVLANVFGADAIVAGAIDTPVTAPAPGQVQVHRPRYEIGVAAVGGTASPDPGEGRERSGRGGRDAWCAELLAGAGFAVTTYADYRSLKWTKLLMNILANAACAILDWTPAQVMADPTAARLEARAWQEALAVMARRRIRPVAWGGYPLPLFLPLARRLPPAALGRVLAGFVAGGRGSKSPSLQLALGAGRPSEVAWLNGAVARAGAEAGLSTPVNAAYTRLLLALTAGESSPEKYRGQPARLAAEIA